MSIEHLSGQFGHGPSLRTPQVASRHGAVARRRDPALQGRIPPRPSGVRDEAASQRRRRRSSESTLVGASELDPAAAPGTALLDDLGDSAGADGAAAFADGEAQALVHGDRVR